VIDNAQESARKEFGDKLEREENRGQIFRVATQIVKNSDVVVGGSCVKDKIGNYYYYYYLYCRTQSTKTNNAATDERKIKQVWKEYFALLLNEEFDWDKDKLDGANEVQGPREDNSGQSSNYASKGWEGTRADYSGSGNVESCR
jgi:hypothetical protein